MNIHEFQTINNLTIKEFRDLARSTCHFNEKTKEAILNTFTENSKINPHEMFEFFIENGLLEKSNTKENTWSATVPLRAIAGASLHKRKNSSKAWDELAKALARTVALSDCGDWNIEAPSKVFLYGSMLNLNKKDYGDADLAISFDVKDDFLELVERQEEWLEKYSDFTSVKYWTSLGFEDQMQLRQDIAAGSNFISIHPCADVKALSEQPNNIGKFPIFTLWENDDLKINEVREDTKVALELSQQWKEKNPQTYLVIESKLNAALSKLGIVAYTEPNFKSSCKEYIKNTLAKELADKLPRLKKYGDDANIVNRMVRMGNIGFEAIGKALRDAPEFNQELSKLDSLLNIMDRKSEASYTKGFTQRETVTIKFK